MPEAKTHEGGCHCGAVRYRATMALAGGMTCNCSRCQKVGWTITFIPAENFELISGEDRLTDYRFNTGHIAHLFCQRCGIESFARGKGPDGKDTVCVNIRCLDGVDLAALPTQQYDGRSK